MIIDQYVIGKRLLVSNQVLIANQACIREISILELNEINTYAKVKNLLNYVVTWESIDSIKIVSILPNLPEYIPYSDLKKIS